MRLRRNGRDIERVLREQRSRLRPELREYLEARAVERPARRRPRIALAAAFTALLLVAFGAVGGVGYAASMAQQAFQTVKRAATPMGPKVPERVNAGADQYRPGFGFGDPNHNHTGPPGLVKKAAPKPKLRRNAIIVSSSFTLNEQAVLWISVHDSTGDKVLISQEGSQIGGVDLDGPPAKTLKFVVLVPRVIGITLRIPLGLDQEPGTYRIGVIAVDKQGHDSRLSFRFRVPSTPINGTNGTDRLVGTPRDDVINGRDGDDVIFGLQGDDRITGGPGDDRITGGPGNDTIFAADGERDIVDCGPGDDTVYADPEDILIACETVRIR